MITHQTKTFEKSNILETKSVITEHLKILHTFSKTIRQTEKLNSKSCLYKRKRFFK